MHVNMVYEIQAFICMSNEYFLKCHLAWSIEPEDMSEMNKF